MGFPSIGRETFFRNSRRDVRRYLRLRHPKCHKVYNLCSEEDRSYDPETFHEYSHEVKFADHNPCPLRQVHTLIQDMHDYLNENPNNVVAIHCKAGKGRTGFAVSCLLMREGLCSSATRALKKFSAARTTDGKGVTIPSQVRYVRWYQVSYRVGAVCDRSVRFVSLCLHDILECSYLGCNVRLQVISTEGLVMLESAESARSRDSKDLVFDLRALDNVFQEDFNVVVWHSKKQLCSRVQSVRLASFWLHAGYIGNSITLPLGTLDNVKTHFKDLPKSFEITCTFEDL